MGRLGEGQGVGGALEMTEPKCLFHPTTELMTFTRAISIEVNT